MTRFISILIVGLSILQLSAKNNTRDEYIRIYYKIAINEMQNYGIPASITMAQGILESGNGNSYLAVEGNNHFAIKCHDWTGPSLRKDDDKKDECFRKYDRALSSYEDHSTFLTTRNRYAFLFDYKQTDYKAWAKGLKKAGYATDSKYPQKLITIIEDNELYLLDEYVLAKRPSEDDLPLCIVKNKDISKDPNQHSSSAVAVVSTENQDNTAANTSYKQYEGEVLSSDNGISYVVVDKDLTLEDVAKQYNIKTWELYKYNDVKRGNKQKPGLGQRIYLEPKMSKGSKNVPTHTVRKGETMYDISQQYGIKLSSLYKLNRMDKGTQPIAGESVNLFKRKSK